MIYLSGVVSPRTEALAGSLPHFGVMCQPDSNVYLHRTAYRWHAADNACFAGSWTEAKWLRWLGAVEPDPRLLFATVPDVVSNWEATNYRWTSYAPKVKRLGLPLAYVAQDGVLPERIPWTELDCLFVGGSTDWKLSEDAFRLARLAKERGKWTHMGRVNSWFRLKCAALAGYDSCDGNVLAYDPPRLDKLLGWLQRLDDEQFLALEWPA